MNTLSGSYIRKMAMFEMAYTMETETDAAVVLRIHWDDDPDTYGADNGPKGKCMKLFETMCADDFCSYGKRKEDA